MTAGTILIARELAHRRGNVALFSRSADRLEGLASEFGIPRPLSRAKSKPSKIKPQVTPYACIDRGLSTGRERNLYDAATLRVASAQKPSNNPPTPIARPSLSRRFRLAFYEH